MSHDQPASPGTPDALTYAAAFPLLGDLLFAGVWSAQPNNLTSIRGMLAAKYPGLVT